MEEVLRKIYYCILQKLPVKFVINIENLKAYKRFLNKKDIKYFE